MASPPYCPGGRLIEWITARKTSAPAGRSSWFGESTTLIGDAQALHAIAQLPERDTEELSGGSAVEAGLAECFEDGLALDAVEIGGQRFARGAVAFPAFLRHGCEAQVLRADLAAGRERERTL